MIWRDHAQFPDAVLSSGEVAMLSGAGKSGKSYIALALAVAAAQAQAKGGDYGEACGLRVAARPVIILSYEDAPKRIDQRAANMDTSASVRLIPDPPQLFRFDADHPAMGPFFRLVPRVGGDPRRGPRPGGGRHRPEGDGRRDQRRRRSDRVPTAIEGEARSGGFGVLLTAHDTKAHRNQVKAGEAPGAGAIAGSGQWHDSPRGVLYLSKHGPGDAPRILEAVKCSYGGTVGGRASYRTTGTMRIRRGIAACVSTNVSTPARLRRRGKTRKPRSASARGPTAKRRRRVTWGKSMSNSVIEARSRPEIVTALARAVWAKDNPGKDCPPDRIPTTETLAAWLPEFPEATHLEAGERLAALYGLSDGGGCRWKLGRTAKLKPRGEWSLTLLAWERPARAAQAGGPWASSKRVHKVWLALPAEDRPKHPLAPLVAAWQGRPRPSEPFKPVNRASLPQLHWITAPEGGRLQAAELPAIYGGETEPPELWLPGMEPEFPAVPLATCAVRASRGHQLTARKRRTLADAHFHCRVSPLAHRR